MSDYRIHPGDGPYDPTEAKEFLARIFGPNYHDARRVKDELFDTEPSTHPENMITARSVGGGLVGLIRIVERFIRVSGQQFKTGFITSVAVHPDWRGKGLAGDLIRTSTSIFQERGFDLSGVIGRRAVDGLYPKYGYVHLARYIGLEITSPAGAASRLKALPFEKTDIDFIRKTYERCYLELAGSIVRDEGVWKFLLKKIENSQGAHRLFTLWDEDRPAGYLTTLGDSLIEAGTEPAYLTDIPAITQTLGLKNLNLHPGHPLFRYCRGAFNTVFSERFALTGGYMARIVRPDLVMQKLGPVMADRAAKLTLPFQTVRILGQEVDLAGGGVSASDQKDHIVFDDPGYAVQLAMGFQNPEDIPGIHWSPGFEATAMLFPNLRFHTCNLDEV